MRIIKNSRGVHFLVTNKSDKQGHNIERIVGALELIMMAVMGIGVAAMVAQMFGIMTGAINPN